MPSGCICIWHGSETDIPSGWVLCNGENNTPDLRDKFILGAGSSHAVKSSGGEEAVTLIESHLPIHTHSFSGTATSSGSHNHTASLNLSGLTTNEAGYHTHTYPYYDGNSSPYNDNGLTENSRNSAGTRSTSQSGGHTHTISGHGTVTINAGGDHMHNITGAIGNTGNGQPHNNMPPYYALCYIMKT